MGEGGFRWLLPMRADPAGTPGSIFRIVYDLFALLIYRDDVVVIKCNGVMPAETEPP